MASQTVYSEGLTEEYNVEVSLYNDNKDLLKERVPEEKITTYTAANEDMKTNRSLADTATEAKATFTKVEKAAQAPLIKRIQKIRDAVKAEFGKSSPEGKVFHVGDVHSNSSAILVGWASDYEKAFPTYKVRLANQGVLPADIAALKTDSIALETINKQQEPSKTDAANATQKYIDSIAFMADIADSIQNAAKFALENHPDILAKFEAAKKLRYTAPSHKKKTTTTTGTTSSSSTDTSASASTTPETK
jgi:hypothetical protein